LSQPPPNPDNSLLRSPSAGAARIHRALKLFILLLAALFVIEWGYAGYHTLVLHAAFPATTPLFNPAVRFSDWTNFTPRVSHYGEPGMQVRTDLGYPYPYPLPSIYIFLLFIRLFPHSLYAYIAFTVLTFAVATLIFCIYLYRRTHASRLILIAVWLTLLLGSPAQFLLNRGNIEVFLWLFVLLGLVSFVRDWKYLAAFFFALAACMKIYPALFFLLFLPRRQYKAAALGVALTAGFSLAALAAVGPTILGALHDMSAAAVFLRHVEIVALNESSLRFDHSLLAIWKQALYFVLELSHPRHFYSHHPLIFSRSVAVYSVLAPVIFTAIYLLRLRAMPLLNQFMALTIFSVILPYVSYEYTLVHIYLVFAVFILFLLQDGDTALAALTDKNLNLVMICFAIVFAPLAYLALEHFQGQIKCLALIALLAVTLLSPMPSTLFGDRPAPVAPTG
jgi:hypothetical protein